ncbi:dual specificity protein phosphatase 18 isoform X2 [Choloepus didactylus]|uniref:dual specificity protein phosphatase 18 isoform X2 n=1 Tax=Choloepus didactylus TaxID=27675 RepID=UPI00189E89DA|nr:dual specificity protein phosphatase 18 isoform X2 [Choloepus didactylus]
MCQWSEDHPLGNPAIGPPVHFPEASWGWLLPSKRLLLCHLPWSQSSRKWPPSLLAERCPTALMTTPPCAFPVQVRQPSVHGLSQITNSLYISSGVAANNKLLLSSSHITTVINVSVESGPGAGPHTAALRRRREPLGHPLPCLPHEVPCHVPAGCPHVDQVTPAHHPAQQRLLGAAHPL